MLLRVMTVVYYFIVSKVLVSMSALGATAPTVFGSVGASIHGFG